jgi:cold shock CspA family protein
MYCCNILLYEVVVFVVLQSFVHARAHIVICSCEHASLPFKGRSSCLKAIERQHKLYDATDNTMVPDTTTTTTHNTITAVIIGPRMEGHVTNLRVREGFGFIKPSPVHLGASNGSNVFFHIGDVFSGSDELAENVEVRYTLVINNRPGEKARAVQVLYVFTMLIR